MCGRLCPTSNTSPHFRQNQPNSHTTTSSDHTIPHHQFHYSSSYSPPLCQNLISNHQNTQECPPTHPQTNLRTMQQKQRPINQICSRICRSSSRWSPLHPIPSSVPPRYPAKLCHFSKAECRKFQICTYWSKNCGTACSFRLAPKASKTRKPSIPYPNMPLLTTSHHRPCTSNPTTSNISSTIVVKLNHCNPTS